MNNFDFKKYFGNLVGMPTTTPKKGVSNVRLVKRSRKTPTYPWLG